MWTCGDAVGLLFGFVLLGCLSCGSIVLRGSGVTMGLIDAVLLCLLFAGTD